METDKIKNTSETEKICKICHTECNENFPSVTPCKCNGSLKYIHVDCLNEWLKVSKITKCSICKYEFKIEKKFKEGTPKDLPFYYIILFILKNLMNIFVQFLCFLYSMTKFILIFTFNSAICKKFIYSASSFHYSFIIGSLFTIVNFAHSIFFNKALKTISSFRARIQSSTLLQNLLAEVSSRSANDSVISQQTNVDQNNSDSNETNEQVLDSFNPSLEINLSIELFRKPTLGNIKKDLKTVGMLCVFSVIYPLIYYFSVLFGYLFQSFNKIFKISQNFYKLTPIFYDFIFETKSHTFFIRMISIIQFFSVLIFILHYLKTKLISQTVKNLFYLVKCYFIIIVSSFFIISSVGIVSHFSFALAFNKGAPIISFSQEWVSILIHCLFGSIFTYLCRDLKQRLMKKFRAGLILKPFKDESFSCFIEYCCDLAAGYFIFRTFANFILISAIPFSLFYLSRINIDFNFEKNNDIFILFYLKSFLLLYKNGSSITKFLTFIFERIISVFSKIFDGDNFLYNKNTEILDKSRLFWGINTRYIEYKYEVLVNKINEIIKGYSDRNEEILTNRSQVFDISSDNESAILRKNNIDPTVNISSFSESDVLRKRNVESTINTNEEQSQKVSSSLINSFSESEKEKIFLRYKITKNRIEKYYGKNHNKKFSLFCRPKCFKLFKILCFISCFAFSCLFFNILFRFSYFLSKLVIFNQNNLKAIIFVYSFCLFLSFSSQIPNLLTGSYKQNLKSILNNLVLSFYTNFIFPFMGSVAFIIINASRESFFEFSNSFIVLNSFSTIISSFFENFFIFSPISTYSVFYIVRQILSFLVLKLAIFFCFIAYTKIITFTSIYIPMIFTITIIVQAIRIGRIIFSGTLMEKIKDYFFLDNTTVANYQHDE